MKQHLEIEYKTHISKDMYDMLMETELFENSAFQRNDYYDTKDLRLFNQHVMCRVRSFDTKDSFEFTLKIPQEDGVLEHELILDTNSLENPQIDALLREFGIDDAVDIERITFSKTNRTIYADEYGEWCLDYSQFENSEDYELEYELFGPNEKAYDHYLSTINAWNIRFEAIEPKFIRALKSSKKLSYK